MDEGQGKKGFVNPIQVQKFLEGVDYPASKEDLIKYAKEQGADENVIATLQAMPGDMFATPVDVSEAIGKIE